VSAPTGVVALRNDDLTVLLEPRRGGRVLAIRDERRGVDWLEPTARDLDAGAPADPGADPALWASHPRGGWDECLPSIVPAHLPARGLPAVGDHGDLWSAAWREVEPATDSAAPASWLAVDAPDGSYSLRRAVELAGPVLRIDYLLTSHTDRDLPFLWSMHPLLPARTDLTRTFPVDTPLLVEYSSSPALMPGTTLGWGRPVPGVGDWVLGVVPQRPVAVKGFAPAPATFSADLDGSALTFRLDPAAVPYVGVWLNHGAWPTAEAPDRHVALEPTTAATDDLAAALNRGQARELPAHGRLAWDLEMIVEEAG
jgi:hypothetical protein